MTRYLVKQKNNLTVNFTFTSKVAEEKSLRYIQRLSFLETCPILSNPSFSVFQ
jgi:hypothetical protein